MAWHDTNDRRRITAKEEKVKTMKGLGGIKRDIPHRKGSKDGEGQSLTNIKKKELTLGAEKQEGH